MAYIRIHEGTTTYPFKLDSLRDCPRHSFPVGDIPESTLAEHGVYPCVEIPQPPVPPRYRLERKEPQNIQGAWVVAWGAIALTDEEWAAKLADQWAYIRAKRNTRLADCDWTQLPDAPASTTTWAVYRQALRDITLQDDPFNILWPVAP